MSKSASVLDSRSSVTARAEGTGARAKVKFGGVTVFVSKPSSEQVKHNISVSTEALERAAKRLIRPGVRLYAKKGVPLYSADPERPGVYIRILDGKMERGVLENGAFKVTG